MANLAARLMGKTPTAPSPTAPAPKPPASATPRTIPAPQLAGSESKVTEPQSANRAAQAYTPKENIAPTPAPPSKAKAPTPSLAPQEDINMTDVNAGPSLFGNADQLAVSPLKLISGRVTNNHFQAAREFAQSATAGRSKSRPSSRAGRQRLLSKEPDRGSSSSSSSSPRSSAATVGSTGYQFLGASQRTSQVPNPRAEVKSGGTGLAALHDRPPVTLTAAVAPTPAPTPVQSPASSRGPAPVERWNAFTTKPSTEKTEDKAVDGLAKSVEKMELNHAHPSTTPPSKKDEIKTRPAWQLADVTNTLKERAANATTPPHLRTKAAAAGIPEKKAVTTTKTAADAMVINDAGWKKTEGATNGVQNHLASTNGIKKEPATPKQPDIKPIAQEQGSKRVETVETPKIKSEPSQDAPKEAMVHGTTERANKATANDHEILGALKMMKDELAAVNTRVGKLEQDNFAMQQDLEKLLQAEERRKFLGTDSAKVPFALDVKCRK